MAVTPIDLYRIGDATGAALDFVTPGADADIINVNKIDWVRATGKGVSVKAVTHRLRKRGDRWWKLPAGTDIPPGLEVYNDHGNHWLVNPVHDMPLMDYTSALAVLNRKFM